MSDLPYWVAFSRYERVNPLRFRRLHSYFPNIAEAWRASTAELQHAGLEPEVAEDFAIKRQDIDPEKEWALLQKENITLLPFTHPDFPPLLAEIYNAPYLLYVRGMLKRTTDRNIAIVGTRKVTEYGKRATEDIATDLARGGMHIVSGLALGVDAIAHETALKEDAYTIAVLGTGIDRFTIYPSHNRRLAERIIEHGGAIVSEYPPATQGLKYHFPARNRIVSGLSRGVVVTEAAESSGALITAKYALEQNREVFAIPGSIYNPSSEGPNKLIALGAHPVTKATDILDVFHLEQAELFTPPTHEPENTDQALLLSHIGSESSHIDELTRKTQFSASHIAGMLSILEIKGRVKNLGGMRYIKTRQT